MNEIGSDIRRYFLENYFRPDQHAEFNDETALVSSGIVDSIGAMKLIGYVEERYGIEFLPREVYLRDLESVASIERAIRRKIEADARGGHPDG